MDYNHKRKNVTVCLATFNGSKYIEDQLNSINIQLIDGDEIIVVDDCSIDNTVEIIKSLNIRFISKLIINDRNIGVNRTFEKALRNASKEVIFLSDQDDVWPSNRINLLSEKISDENWLINGNFKIFYNDLQNLYSQKHELQLIDSKLILKNIIKIFFSKIDYYGSNMVMKRDLLEYILPFPQNIESHDIWIVLVAILMKKNYHIENITLFRRIHGNNFSEKKRKLSSKLYSRIIYIQNIFQIYVKLKEKI